MIYFVFNKFSGTYSYDREEYIANKCELLFKDNFVITYTKHNNDNFIPDIISDNLVQDDIIIAIGGDGTLNLCLQFIHENDLNDKILLGFIPTGTGNNMVKISKLSKNILEALKIIKDKKIKKLQYGLINNSKVFFNFSLGFTSYVLNNRKTKTLAGYAIDGLRNYFKFDHAKVKISSNTHDIEEKLFVAFFINTTHYLSFVRFRKENNTSNKLDLFYLPRSNKFVSILKLIPLLLGVKFFKTKTSDNFVVELQNDQEIEVDGDIYRTKEKTLNVMNQNSINFISG